jgi:hypothetical protein
MEKNWTNQNIDLNTLTDGITKFLEDEDFSLAVLKEEKGYVIFTDESPRHKIGGGLCIYIFGNPNDFSIKIEREKFEGGKISFPPLLASMFGGGYFLLKHLRSDEEFVNFTKSFWKNVNQIILMVKNELQGSRNV